MTRCAWRNFDCLRKATYRIEVNGAVVANYCVDHIERIITILTEVHIDYTMRTLSGETT